MKTIKSDEAALSPLDRFGHAGKIKPRRYREVLGVLWENKTKEDDHLPWGGPTSTRKDSPACAITPRSSRCLIRRIAEPLTGREVRYIGEREPCRCFTRRLVVSDSTLPLLFRERHVIVFTDALQDQKRR